MKKHTKDKEKAEKNSAYIRECQLHRQVDPSDVTVASTEEDMIRESE